MPTGEYHSVGFFIYSSCCTGLTEALSYYPFFFTAIHTGMRLAVLCGLCWDRIDFRMKQISVTRTRDKAGLKDSTKAKLKRIIPMLSEVRVMLLAIHAKKMNGKFVFVEKDGGEVKYAHFSPDHLQGSLRFMNMIEDETMSDVPSSYQREKDESENLVILME